MAKGFDLRKGRVEVKVPWVFPDSDYSIVCESSLRTLSKSRRGSSINAFQYSGILAIGAITSRFKAPCDEDEGLWSTEVDCALERWTSDKFGDKRIITILKCDTYCTKYCYKWENMVHICSL